MRRRLILLAAAYAAALGSFGAVSALTTAADTGPPPAETVAGYWACVAIDEVNIGACLANPLPDPSSLPSI